jgi:hypothetical protein
MRAGDPERSDIVVFGCPQLTLDEALHLASHLSGAQASRFLEDAGGPEGGKPPVFVAFRPEGRYGHLAPSAVKAPKLSFIDVTTPSGKSPRT